MHTTIPILFLRVWYRFLSAAAGTTFGGNPLAAAAALEVVRRIADPAFLESARSKGRLLREQMQRLQKLHPQTILEIRQPIDDGLFMGVDFQAPVKAFQQECARNGLLLISAGDNTLRICPPLTISEDELLHGVTVMEKCLAAM